MGIANCVSATEAIRFLRTASDPNARFFIVGQKPDLNFRGNVRFVKDGWTLQVYWTNGFFSYVDSLVAPWGSIGTRTQWHEDDGVPDHLEDLLTEEEFGWLCWSLMAADAEENPSNEDQFTRRNQRESFRVSVRKTHRLM